jgi:hypothetical protein
MISLTEVLSNSKNEFHYIAIGSASNLKMKNLEKLPMADQHQLPFFLYERLRLQDTEWMPIKILLVDPLLEDPPYCVSSSSLPNEWKKINDQHYICPEQKIEVLTFNHYVYYDDEEQKREMKYINFLPFLKMCHETSIKNNNLLLVHDFTGNDIYKLNDIFHKSPKCQYGLSVDRNTNCYIDLMDTINQVIILPNYTFFQPYTMSNKEICGVYHKMNTMEKIQMAHVIGYRLKKMHTYYYPFYRQLKIYLGGNKNMLQRIKSWEDVPNEINKEYKNYLLTKDETLLMLCSDILLNKLKEEWRSLLIEKNDQLIDYFEELCLHGDLYRSGETIMRILREMINKYL